MHFAKGQLPPVNGVWSLTLYDANYYFVPNDIGRNNLSSRSKLVYKADGSVDLLIQHDAPKVGLSENWLPASDAPFILMLRLYWPNKTAPRISGSWQPPGVSKTQ